MSRVVILLLRIAIAGAILFGLFGAAVVIPTTTAETPPMPPSPTACPWPAARPGSTRLHSWGEIRWRTTAVEIAGWPASRRVNCDLTTPADEVDLRWVADDAASSVHSWSE